MGLSSAQKEIIKKMRSGWELGADTGVKGGCWMQKGGLGRGGKAEMVSGSSLRVLVRQGLVEAGKWDFPTQKYHLTRLGKTVKL